MRILPNIMWIKESVLSILATIVILAASNICSLAQEKLPKPIAVTVVPTQPLRFGTIALGSSGGTVSISATGTRSATGSVIPLSLGSVYSTALFEITANPGTLISILNGPDANMTGSNGGSITLHLGGSFPTSPLVTTAIAPATTAITIGGTLTIGSSSANPPGNYSGVYYITFIQE